MALCDLNEVPFSFLNLSSSRPKSASPFPKTLPENKSFFSLSYGAAKEEAALYISGSLVISGDIDQVVRQLLSEVGVSDIKEGAIFKTDSSVPQASLKEVDSPIVLEEINYSGVQEADDINLLLDALATSMLQNPSAKFDIVFQNFTVDIPAIAKFPTHILTALHAKLMEKDLKTSTPATQS